MPKSQWGTSGYTGKPNSLKVAVYFMLVLIIALLAGFITAGLREGWFESITDMLYF